MKKIIDGKMYNTDTAELIGNDYSALGKSDFRYYDESLYVTKKGTFFLAGEGGAMSQWAAHYAGCSGWGAGVIVMNKGCARHWCETHDIDTDVIEKYFEVEEA